MIDKLVYTFSMHILTSLSVDEILLPRYVNLSTNFRGLPLKVDMAQFIILYTYYKKKSPVPATKLSSDCNIMAEGFRFMPLGLVRLRTFRLGAWVT